MSTMMNPYLSGLELRKALCEALNIVHGHHWLTDKPGSICRDCGVRYDAEELATEPCYDSLPALECDPAEFWPEFEKWWTSVEWPGDGFVQGNNYSCGKGVCNWFDIYLRGKRYNSCGDMKATLTTAGCRAWLQALKAEAQ